MSASPFARARRQLVASLTDALRHPHPSIATRGLSPFEAAAVAAGLVDVVEAIPASELACASQNVAALLHDHTTDADAATAMDTLISILEDAAKRCGVPAEVIREAMERARGHE